MNELETQLAELVKKGIEVAEKTGDFVIDQAPQLLQEFYRWHIAENIFFMLLAIVILLCGRYLPYLWLSKFSEYDDVKFFKKSGDEGGMFAYIFLISCGITFLIMFSSAIYDLTYLILAPKLYLIDYFIR